MNHFEKINELIESSDNSEIHKSIMKGVVMREENRQESHRDDMNLIEKFAGSARVSEILLSNEDVKIFKVYGRDEWDIKYPYRSIFRVGEDNWRLIHTVASSFDIAFLYYLENRHLGSNSNFTQFATKMLNIVEA